MAQKYRKIDPRIWDDEKFEQLPPMAKLLCFYILTAQSNRCGIFKYSPALAIEKTGIDADSCATAMAQVISIVGWSYDKARKVIYIPRWWKYNPPENSSHLKGCLDDIHDLPQTVLLYKFASNIEFLPKHCVDTFSTAMGTAVGTGVPHQEQEQEQEQEQNKDDDKGAGKSSSENPSGPLPPTGSDEEANLPGMADAFRLIREHPAVIPEYVNPQRRRKLAEAVAMYGYRALFEALTIAGEKAMPDRRIDYALTVATNARAKESVGSGPARKTARQANIERVHKAIDDGTLGKK